jgi:hypothetical protein
MKSSRINYYSGFDPTSIPGCQLWLDAADSSTVTFSGSNVTQWRDKSSNAAHASNSTGSNLPTVSTNSSNLPALDFNTAYLQNDTSMVVTTNTTFIVAEERTAGANRGTYHGLIVFKPVSGGPIAGINDFAATNSLMFSTPNNEATVSLFIYGNIGSFPQLQITGNGNLNYGLYEAVLQNSGNSISYLNGTSNSSFALPARTSNSVGYVLSARQFSNVGLYSKFKISEIISYNTTFGTAERQQLEGYLARKWGLQGSLPAAHPFKSIPPVLRPFAPIDIPDCALWFDAADTSTITGTTQVTAWVNKGSLATTASNRTGSCTSGNTLANGLNFIRCPAGTDLGFTTALNTQARTWFVVGRNLTQLNVSPQNFWGPIGQTGNTGQDSIVFLRVGASDFRGYIGPTGIAITVEGQFSTDPLNVINIYSWVNSTSSNSNVVTQNGTSLTLTLSANAANYNTSSLTYTINRQSYNTGSDYFEIVYYNRAITPRERQQVEGYLARKWEIQSSIVAGHPYRFGLPALTLGFTPVAISGCQLWLDAADQKTLTLSGTTITGWNDKSGLGNNTTGGSGTISLISNGINGLSVASLSNTYLTGGFATAFTGTQLQCFAVAVMDSNSTAFGRILSLGRPGVHDFNQTTTTFPFIRDSDTSRVMIGRNNSYLAVNTPGYNIPFIVQSGHNGATEFIAVNGATQSTQNTGVGTAFNITSYGIGTNTNTGDTLSFWRGYIAEVIYYNGSLFTTAQRQIVEGYLAWKWGLQGSLPSLHPYRFIRP